VFVEKLPTDATSGAPAGLESCGDIDTVIPSASSIELSATIKWFNISKGYGFIVPDNGMPDVLLHVTCLRQHGFQIVQEGARVVLEAVQRARGLTAVRILSIDNSTAANSAQSRPALSRVLGTPVSALQRAQVKWFNRQRGFGFLTLGEGARDIFVHMETLHSYGMTELRVGQAVLVRASAGPNGLMAVEVRPGATLAQMES
jgi:CspA family cold shock protein